MTNRIVEVLDSYGEFSVMLPDGTLIFCTVNSEDNEEAFFVANTINNIYNDLMSLRNGESVVVPKNREHAHNIKLVAENYLQED